MRLFDNSYFRNIYSTFPQQQVFICTCVRKEFFDLAVVPVVSVIQDGYDGMRYVEGEEQRKQPRERRVETDEECIEKIISEVVMEQDGNGYHVVLGKILNLFPNCP